MRTNKRFPRVSLLAIVVLIGCGLPDKQSRNEAIERWLNAEYGSVRIRCCGKMDLDHDAVTLLKKVEAAGLITVQEVPQAYWDSFLRSTQGLSQPFEITATEKFKQLVGIKPEDADQDVAHGGVGVALPIHKARLQSIVTDQEYKGPLASLGDKHRLVLGTYKTIPTPEAAVLGPDLAPQAEQLLQFRCIARYSGVKKEWSVVAVDAGSINPERWFTTNVK